MQRGVKKDWCTAELDEAEDNKKGFENEIFDFETAIDSANQTIMALKLENQAVDVTRGPKLK